MKVFVSVDMEGLAGIVNWDQQTSDREMFRAALHDQLSWVVEGILRSPHNAEVEQITVADAHGMGTNLLYSVASELDERLYLVSGSPRRTYMMAGLDDSYDVCFLVGYHAGSGQPMGDMDHTYSGKTVATLRINGCEMNEATTNAALAGDYGVPVGLVVGDSGLRAQLEGWQALPWANFVETKQSLSSRAAIMRPRAAIRADTVAAVADALDRAAAMPLYTVAHPCELELVFRRTVMADEVAQVPGTRRLDGHTVSIGCRDMAELMCGISALTTLAGCVE